MMRFLCLFGLATAMLATPALANLKANAELATTPVVIESNIDITLADGNIPQLNQEQLKKMQEKAEQGDSEAMAMMGALYVSGVLVPKDIQKGLKYLKDDSNKNNPNVLLILGGLYLAGQDVPQDIPLAKTYLQKSAKLGNAMAQSILRELQKSEK